MFIKSISWIDKDAEEASVVVTDGIYECLAFCHPCRVKAGDAVTAPLQSLEEKSVVSVEAQIGPIIERQGGNSWGHRVIAVIENKGRKIVTVGAIRIALNELPGDLKDGDAVECYPTRLDLIR